MLRTFVLLTWRQRSTSKCFQLDIVEELPEACKLIEVVSLISVRLGNFKTFLHGNLSQMAHERKVLDDALMVGGIVRINNVIPLSMSDRVTTLVGYIG
ncbi:hypothetical protein D3C84_1061030 [compost metagenome]